MKHMALFSGIGGFMYATERQGIDTVWANEFDQKCCDTLTLNFPETTICRKSISEITSDDLSNVQEGIDLLTAGFPCQPFSSAGGTFAAFEDERGQLFFDIPRIISLMSEPPKIVLLENVPNLKVFDKGALLKTILNSMRFAGYWVSEKNCVILDSSKFGATPQRRERLFIVCAHKNYFKSNPFDFSTLSLPKRPKLFEIIDRNIMPGEEYYLSPENKYFKMINALANESGRDRLYQIRRVIARACPKDICPTLTANMGGGGHNVPFVFDKFGLRRLTESECLKLQGFKPSDMQFPENVVSSDVRKMVGNAVCVGVIENILNEVLKAFFEEPGKRNYG